MNDKNQSKIGIDHTGNWTPAQYAIDAGWDYTCVETTAKKGVSSDDAEGLTEDQQSALHDFCKSRVLERAIEEAGAVRHSTCVIEFDSPEDKGNFAKWANRQKGATKDGYPVQVRGVDMSIALSAVQRAKKVS